MNKLTTILALSTALVSSSIAVAQDAATTEPAKGWLARQILGDSLEKDSGIIIEGLAQASFAYSANATDANDDFAATGNAGPLFFKEDDGFDLNQIGLFMHKPVKSNVISRVTPTPAPMPEDYDIGFGFRAMYGSDVYFMTTEGFDDRWNFNGDAGDPYAPNSTAEKYKFALPEMYVEAYAPVLGGTNVMIGSWFTGVGHDIGVPYDPPNAFFSHPWAFQYSPAKHFGVLASSNVMQNDSGILGMEIGLVRGWNTMEDINDSPAYIVNLRWRSPDMATWIDVESYHGDEAARGNLSDNPGSLRVKSTTDAWRHHYNIDISHKLDDTKTLRVGGIYGTQEAGNISTDPNAVAGHLITKDSAWYGVLAELRYQASPKTTYNFRAEWMADPDAAKFNTQAGEFYGLTANVNYKVNEFLQLRPEIRYDQFQSEVSGVKYFADGQNDQIAASLDAIFTF